MDAGDVDPHWGLSPAIGAASFAQYDFEDALGVE